MESLISANTTNRSVHRVQEHTGQGSTRTGRIVQSEVAVVCASTRTQMATAPKVSQRTTSRSLVAATSDPEPSRKTANAEKPNRYEIKPCQYKPTENFRNLVQKSFNHLKSNSGVREKNPVVFCMIVAGEIDRLTVAAAREDAQENENHDFMVYQFAPYYQQDLQKALAIIKHKTDNGCGWEYYTEIASIGKHLELQSDKSSDRSIDWKSLKDVSLKIVEDTLEFLKYMQTHPYEHAVNQSSVIIDCLLSAQCDSQHPGLIDPEKVSEITKKKEDLMKIIKANLARGDTDTDIEKLKEDVHHGIASMLDKKLYYYVLHKRSMKLKEQYHKQNKAAPQEIADQVFYDLINVHNECLAVLQDFPALANRVAKKIALVARFNMDIAISNDVRLEQRMTRIIMNMVADNWLPKYYGTLCLRCTQPEFSEFSLQTATRTTDQMSRITDNHCKEQLAAIDSLIETGNKEESGKEDYYLKACEKLRQLLHDHHIAEIEALHNGKSYTHRITKIKNTLRNQLFMPFIRLFIDCKKEPKSSMIRIMAEFHPAFVRLIPYAFVLDDMNDRNNWSSMLGYSLVDIIEKLSEVNSFEEKDIDLLLELKHLAAHIPNIYLWNKIENIAPRLLKFVPQNTSETLIKKVEVLHQWIADLYRLHIISDNNKQLNMQMNLWKNTTRDAVSKRGMISSAMPLASVQSFNIDQATPESVVVQEKKVTASVISPESQACFEKDKSLASGFADKTEQLALTSIDMVMATEQASQATPLSQGADQPSSRIDKHVPQSTITVAVETMTANENMETRKPDLKAVNRSIREDQEDVMIISPGEAQTGRNVSCDAAIPVTTSQMATAPNTTRQTIFDNEMAAQSVPETTERMASDAEPAAFNVMKCEYKATEMLQAEIASSLNRLKKIHDMDGSFSLPFCLGVIEEFIYLIKKHNLNDTEDESYKYLVFQLSPYYTKSLPSALATLHQKATDKTGWKLYKEIVIIAKKFWLQPDESANKSANKKLLNDIIQQQLDNELEYLQHVAHNPVRDTVTEPCRFYHGTCDIISYMLSSKTFADHNNFIDKTKKAWIETQKARLIGIIENNHDKSAVGLTYEELERLACSKTDNPLVRRQYIELLMSRVNIIRNKAFAKDKKVENPGPYLDKLRYWYDRCCTHFSEFRVAGFNEFHALRLNLEATMSGIVKQMLENHIKDGTQLDEMWLDVLHKLRDRNALSESGKKLFLFYKELQESAQAVTGTTVRTERITDTQCQQRLDEICSDLSAKSRYSLLIAAKKLRRLWGAHGHEIKTLSHADSHSERMDKIKDELCRNLFNPVIKQLEEYTDKEMASKRTDREMTKYHDDVIELTPYLFVLRDDRNRLRWKQAACNVWRFHIAEITKANSLTERDVDYLLQLKRAAPDVPDSRARIILEQALIQLLSIIKRDGIGQVPVEKIMTLSRWIEDLIHIREYNKEQQRSNKKQLAELNEDWKKASKHVTVSVAFDQPASDVVSIQLNSKTSQPRKRGSSFMPTAASAIKIPRMDAP